VIIAVAFTTVNATPRNYMTRLNLDGSLDMTGNWYYLSLNGAVRTIALQPDGKIMIGGDFWQIYDAYQQAWIVRNRMARLNANGGVDMTFSNPFLNGTVRTICVGSDGYITCGGEFVNNSPYSPNYIARYSSSGSMQWSV